jgi:DNA-binding NarL/FixJ family response regulator
MPDRPLKVIVVDDHDGFRKNLVALLIERGIEVIGETARAPEGIRQASELQPDAVLMDLVMPGMSGIEATQRLAAAAPLTRVLVLTVVAEDRYVLDALLAGACGYLLKGASIEEIVAGLKAAVEGEAIISPRVAGRLVARLREGDATLPLDGSELTTREREVLELLAEGLDNAGISQRLGLSQHTVKNYVSSILVKLQVANRTQAAVRAVRGGMLE